MSAFFAKKSAFLARNSTYTPSNSCVKDFVILFSVFLRQTVTVNANVSFTDYASGLLQIAHKLGK